MSFSGAIEAFGKLPRDFSLVMVSTSIGRGNIRFFGVSEGPFSSHYAFVQLSTIRPTMLFVANSSHFLFDMCSVCILHQAMFSFVAS